MEQHNIVGSEYDQLVTCSSIVRDEQIPGVAKVRKHPSWRIRYRTGENANVLVAYTKH